ncbi:MAG: glutamate-cysteine ligase family protein [Phycisphaeraceae bacterium]
MTSSNSPATYRYPIGLFERYGIELEYMIVDRHTLEVKPMCDELIRTVCGAYESEIVPEHLPGGIAWSNELALHVIEFKTTEPAVSLDKLDQLFLKHIQHANALLARSHACLLPTAMHPWMNPYKELRLWPHEASPIYDAFNRIFDCRGHGWANLQSTHLNLPFANDQEFADLHAAIRAVLPLIPALAASSPLADARITHMLDTRVEMYRRNAHRIPSVTGHVIPEPIYTRHEYEHGLLAGIYRDISPFDPQRILQYEWLNARGCIARFDRGTIELRLIDIQECPAADLAIVKLITETIRSLTRGRWISPQDTAMLRCGPLVDLLDQTTRDADGAIVSNQDLLRALGMPEQPVRALDVWQKLAHELIAPTDPAYDCLRMIFKEGTLARRILRAAGPTPTRAVLHQIYQQLADCLENNTLFHPFGRVEGN